MGVVVVGEKKKKKKKKVSNVSKSVFESKPKESMADTSHACVGVAIDLNTPSVFESMPAETKASVGHSSGVQLPDANEASVFESKPRASTAHVSSEKPVLPDMEGPSVCESTPAISRASITAADAVPIPNGGVCESQPAESNAHVKALDPATAEVDQTSVFENIPGKSLASCTHNVVVEGVVEGQHVFESQPESRKTDAAHGIEAAESGFDGWSMTGMRLDSLDVL